MEKDGKTECYIYFCSGERKLKRGEIEGPIEKNSKKFLKKIVQSFVFYEERKKFRENQFWFRNKLKKKL
jgi:hypothetical protein